MDAPAPTTKEEKVTVLCNRCSVFLFFIPSLPSSIGEQWCSLTRNTTHTHTHATYTLGGVHALVRGNLLQPLCRWLSIQSTSIRHGRDGRRWVMNKFLTRRKIDVAILFPINLRLHESTTLGIACHQPARFRFNKPTVVLTTTTFPLSIKHFLLFTLINSRSSLNKTS